MRTVFTAWILALSLAACRSQEPAPIAEAPAPPPEPSETALTALAQATEAVQDWRQELEAGEPLDDGALLSLRGTAQILGHELQELMVQVAVLDAAVRQDPQQRARREVLTMRARGIAQPWIDGMRALGEGAAARRDVALGEIREALEGEDEDRQLAGLITLQSVGDVQYDKASLRSLVLPFVVQGKGELLVAALCALCVTEPHPEDLELVHAAWERDSEGLGDQTLHFLKWYGGGHLEGRSEEIALECLADVDGRRVNQQLNGLWGARVGPALEARVLELSRSSDRSVRHGAIYFGLATFEPKSEAVVDALIETLSDSDPGDRDRALWGLGLGVPAELQPKVAAALVELHDRLADPSARKVCRELVARYGGAEAEQELLR